MNEFDDPELGRRLRAAAGLPPDMYFAKDEVQRRVARARRRRIAALSTTAAVVLLSFGLVAAVGGRDPDHRLGTTSPSPTSATEPEVATTSPASSEPTTSVAGLVPTTEVVADTTLPSDSTSLPAGDTSVPAAVTPTNPTLPGHTSPTTPAKPSVTTAPPAQTAPITPAPPAPTTTAPPAADVTQTFTSTGGSIVVRLSGGRLQLVSSTPNTAAGFGLHEQQSSRTEVEVQFESSNHHSKITVKIVNGHMSGASEEEGEGAPLGSESNGSSSSSTTSSTSPSTPSSTEPNDG